MVPCERDRAKRSSVAGNFLRWFRQLEEATAGGRCLAGNSGSGAGFDADDDRNDGAVVMRMEAGAPAPPEIVRSERRLIYQAAVALFGGF